MTENTKASVPGSDTPARWDIDYIWHPFTQHREWSQTPPLFIERGEGSYLIDSNGNRYIDGVSSIWAIVHGHGVARINDVIEHQVKKISFSTMLGLTHEPAATLAKKLADLTPPGLKRVFYSESGSTAVEIALKMAYQYWQNRGKAFAGKSRFLCLNNGYHGDTIGAVSVGGIDLFHEIYRPLLFETFRAPSPYCYRCELGLDPDSCSMACAGEVEAILNKHAPEICAMIMEPLVQGAGGILTAPHGYLKRVADACKAHDVLLIADEVAVGFGRTGTMFACEQEGVSPDLMALGKGITGGYLPLAATVVKEKIYQEFLGDYEENKTFFHGHTYTGYPPACAAALASLALFEENRVIESLPPKIEQLGRGLSRMAGHPHVGDIRQRGVMIGIELVLDKRTKEPYPPGDRLGHRIAMECRKHGAIIRPLGDVLVLNPPLSITGNEISKLLDAVEHSIREVLG